MASSGNDLFAGLSLVPSASLNTDDVADSKQQQANSISSPMTTRPTIQQPTAPPTAAEAAAAPPVRNAPVTDKLLNLLGGETTASPPPSPRKPVARANAIGSPKATPTPVSPTPVAVPKTTPVPPAPPPLAVSPPKFAPAAKRQTSGTKKRAPKVAIGTQKTEPLPSSPVVAAKSAVPVAFAAPTASIPEPNINVTVETKDATMKDSVMIDDDSNAKPTSADVETAAAAPATTEPKKENGSSASQKKESVEDNTTVGTSNVSASSASKHPIETNTSKNIAEPSATAGSVAATSDATPPQTAKAKAPPAAKLPAKAPPPTTPVRTSEKPPAIVDEAGGTEKQRSSLRGVGVVKSDTPIPNCDIALKIFRKFAQKTQSDVPESHGGTQRLSLWTKYVSGTPTEYDTRFDAYQQFMQSIAMEENGDGDEPKENNDTDGADADAVVDAVFGESGDTMQKARAAMASFCHLLSVWGHASSRMAEMPEKKGAAFETFCGMVITGFDTATSLVSHGCLDGVMIGLGPNKDEFHTASSVLAESVFSGDQSQPANELAAMKFLLSTGCRVGVDGEALLRGSHLLQTIRVLYHVFLSTPTEANKTTARASLQQLVTSVFIRMIATPLSSSSSSAQDNSDEHDEHNNIEAVPSNMTKGIAEEGVGPVFPSENHRDAFLVLRSLCKLSLRDQNAHSDIIWDSSKDPTGRSPNYGTGGNNSKTVEGGLQQLFARAIHPAMESKLLALDLLLYVLKRTDMSGSFLQECGPQFHYAVRNYLCVSLLKNCTSDDTTVVKLSLLVFVPIFKTFRSILKAEIEAFVTNVFFVILDSKNSPIEHKSLVVTLFNEICSDPTTLAEIFLNYDCDLSAVDLFHRIINTLSKVARMTDADASDSSTATTMSSLISGSGGSRMERIRTQHRELRLNAMRALRQVLASLNASIVEPMRQINASPSTEEKESEDRSEAAQPSKTVENVQSNGESPKKSLVEIYDDKKKRRKEDSEIVLRFNQKPKAGINYAQKCGHIDSSDPADVARFLLKNKDRFEKTQIGEYLGREPDYDNGMAMKVLNQYVQQMDFDGLQFDNAIRYYLSGFRLPGEAQKIDRILEKFAERYSEQNPDAFPSADVAFILSFSIIMLNTDLHNPSIKEERKMTKDGFIRNNRGICDGQDLPKEMLLDIFDRIKENPISLKEDDDARERAADPAKAGNALSPAVFFTNHYDEMDKTKESNFMKERDQIVRTTESLLKRRRHGADGKAGHRKTRSSNNTGKHLHLRYVRTDDSGLRDEYVAPMFEVTWGPALAAFSTAMESANGTVGALLAIASDEELEAAAINAAETIEVCLTGFRFAICTAGLVGNDVARDSFMFALSRFSQLGTGVLLEPRHVRCIQTMAVIARSDGELLGSSWEHIFKALSEINRFHQLFQMMARNDRVVAAAAQRRKARLIARGEQRKKKERQRAEREESESLDPASLESDDDSSDGYSSDPGSSLFDSDDYSFNDDMNSKEIDEANARTVYEAVAEDIIEAIYERSSSMSTSAVREFILQLCRVSRMEISDFGGSVANDFNEVSLTSVKYRRKHELLSQSASNETEGFHHQQTNIYSLQKLVEVTHYNMDSRPRLVFNDIWTTVSASLTGTALHSNPAVAMYAVDSFRQLSTQYLQREELGVFEFQRRFLKPLEIVMTRSEISTTKELLLRCVERIILMFGSPQEENKGGMLRSGWRPVLKVLGLAGRDSDVEIAKIGFEMLNTQIEVCLNQCKEYGENASGQGILLVERFVDLVDALLTYVGGPHEEMSLQSIDDLLKLCDFLADESTVSPLLKKRRSKADGNEISSNEVLELWWPILLGLSRSVGDTRKKVRQKSLGSLTKIVSTHFFPPSENQEPLEEESKSKYIQTLQLVYRGIFSSVLEFGDEHAPNTKTPELPSDLERFLSAKNSGDPQKSDEATPSPSWVDTTFDPFMDDCIHICLRSMKVFDDDTLVEDIFAMFNSCFISDSGALVVKGLRRLEIFITSDLRTTSISDDTWATVSHMLRRCLSVRDLPRKPSSAQNGDDDPEAPNPELQYQEGIREFTAEDSMFVDRRYIGSNTIHVIGKFMETERFNESLSLRWRLFLVSGLGRAINDWEIAAGIIANYSNDSHILNAPNYLETAYYGRKWMNRFLLQMAVMKEIEGTAAEGTRQAAAQEVVKEQTRALVSTLLAKEAVVAGDGKKLASDVKSFDQLMNLVQDMLAGYSKLTDEHLSQMSWLNPVLSSCIHTSNEDVRLSIQKLVERLH
jgi:Sec7-like guanine-nucleotide exchange factor